MNRIKPGAVAVHLDMAALLMVPQNHLPVHRELLKAVARFSVVTASLQTSLRLKLALRLRTAVTAAPSPEPPVRSLETATSGARSPGGKESDR